MDDVPLLFAESVARFIDISSLCSLKLSRSSLFGNVGRSLLKKIILHVTLNVVYNPAAGTFDYCLTSRRDCEFVWGIRPYTYNPADHRVVSGFEVILRERKRSLGKVEQTWTTATPDSDSTLLKLLRAPFVRTELRLNVKCPELLKLLPDYYTFNCISAYDCDEVLDAIIRRSQECGRLERLYCNQFLIKRGIKASIDWISTNKRLRMICYCSIVNPESVRSALNSIGVQ